MDLYSCLPFAIGVFSLLVEVRETPWRRRYHVYAVVFHDAKSFVLRRTYVVLYCGIFEPQPQTMPG